jgi:DnaJ-class molecular chaperone
MATDTDPGATPDPATAEPCMACRGTGQVISTLGGERRTVACPWCDGTGRRLPAHDAQARRRERDSGAQSAATDADGSPPEPPDTAA